MAEEHLAASGPDDDSEPDAVLPAGSADGVRPKKSRRKHTSTGLGATVKPDRLATRTAEILAG